MRVEQLAVMAKQPHEQLHREDVSQESKVRPNCAHRLNDYPTCHASAGRSEPDYKKVTDGDTLKPWRAPPVPRFYGSVVAPQGFSRCARRFAALTRASAPRLRSFTWAAPRAVVIMD